MRNNHEVIVRNRARKIDIDYQCFHTLEEALAFKDQMLKEYPFATVYIEDQYNYDDTFEGPEVVQW